MIFQQIVNGYFVLNKGN